MANRNLQEIPRFDNRISFMYYEKGKIDQYQKALAYHFLEKIIPIPVENLNLLLLGPGTTVTHAAIKRAAEARCLIAWVGERGVRYYAGGMPLAYSAKNILAQAVAYGVEDTRRKVVRRMYQFRFSEILNESLSIEQIRGKEGIRVRDIYKEMSEKYDVEWKGRNYNSDVWAAGDRINRALSSANSCLYGICHAAIFSAGYSPAIGFVHTGKQLSFVYDVADLYKHESAIPIAFEAVGANENNVERYVRKKMRDYFREKKFLKKVIPDIGKIIHGSDYNRESYDKPEGRDIPVNVGAETGSIRS